MNRECTLSQTAAGRDARAGKQWATLVLGALGVVYGDIGTSPLYTMKELFGHATGLTPTPEHLIGATSTIIWAIMLVVSLKYVLLILRADNRGEGGGLALTSLASSAVADRARLQTVLLLLGVFGAALFCADSIITPAITVMGAVEGLGLVTPGVEPYIVPIALAIIVALFMIQRFGTAAVGRFFGPIIVVWFGTLACVGILQILQAPAILAALNPLHALSFMLERGPYLLVTVGAVVLALTGAEALYADMGHFGRRPIRLAWSFLVLPSLALNYLGQGALLIHQPQAVDNPFYRMFPAWAIIPAVLIATLAAIIASQAVISGTYSMAKQAIQLGFLPRMTIRYTSSNEIGQIYVPVVNWLLMGGVVVAVIGFGSSSALAGAYGIAVTTTMLITTLLTFFVVRDAWRLPRPVAIGATVIFVALDLLLVAGCMAKLFDGGWMPLAVAALLFMLMSTWKRGRTILLEAIGQDDMPTESFIASMRHAGVPRAERTAVFLVSNPDTVPQALLHNLKHNQVLHHRNVLLTVRFHDVPWVKENDQLSVQYLADNFWLVEVHYGFMDVPDVPKALEQAARHGLDIPYFETSYFLSRESVVSTKGTGMAQWRERIFIGMSKNAGSAADFFKLPSSAVVELGTRVHI